MDNTPKQQGPLSWLIPALLLTAGFILMVIKIVADSEPGAIPLFMVLTGLVWLMLIKRKRRLTN